MEMLTTDEVSPVVKSICTKGACMLLSAVSSTYNADDDMISLLRIASFSPKKVF